MTYVYMYRFEESLGASYLAAPFDLPSARRWLKRRYGENLITLTEI